MATCEHKNKCNNSTGECGKLSHPFMNAKKGCYEPLEDSAPSGTLDLLVEPGVVGIVSCNITVDCPHCKNSLDLSQDPYGDDEWSELGGYIFGFVDKPAKWKGLEMEYECSHCNKVFILKGLEY